MNILLRNLPKLLISVLLLAGQTTPSLAFVYPISSEPNRPATAPGDEFWDDRFSVLGVSGYVRAIAVSGSSVFVGGNFSSVGGVNASSIARWDSELGTWSALGQGISGEVYAIAAAGQYVYAGGLFNAVGGVPSVPGAQSIARWDSVTNTWSALGSGIPGYVYALAVDGEDVYAGGLFNSVGEIPSVPGTQSIARWNATTNTWTALGSGIPGYVYAIAVDGEDVYAGGLFNAAGGYPSVPGTQSIARWNNTTKTWSALDQGIPGYVYAIAVDGEDVYASGLFNATGGYPSVPGTQSIAQWNASSNTWAALGSGIPGYVYAIAAGPDGLYVGGLFNAVGDKASNNFGLWHGNLSNPSNPADVYWDDRFGGVLTYGSFVSDIAVNGEDVYVGGNFVYADGLPGTRGIAKWNSHTGVWSTVGNGINDGRVDAVAIGGNDVYIGGPFRKIYGSPEDFIARWDGTSWSALGSGLNGPVRDIQIHGDDVYAFGTFTGAGGQAANNIARWDSTTGAWSPLGSGIGFGASAMAIAPDGSVLVAGITQAGGASVNYVARWNGSAWTDFGSGLTCCVTSITVNAGAIYVGGSFNKSDGAVANFLATRSGAEWIQVGDLNSSVSAVALSGERMFVGGSFTEASGVSVNNIAKWDGERWSALGSGLDFPPGRLVLDGSDLYVGGMFKKAGDKPSYTFALWHDGNLTLPGGSISGRVTDPGGKPLAGAPVQICHAGIRGVCVWSGKTDAQGFYLAGHLIAGDYTLKAHPHAAVSYVPASSHLPPLVAGGSLSGQDIQLHNVQIPPPGTSLKPARPGGAGIPLVDWKKPLQLVTQGCAGGSASYRITQDGEQLLSGPMTEQLAGQYIAAIPALAPNYGYGTAAISIQCPGPAKPDEEIPFTLYIEPGNVVSTLDDEPIPDATVTLFSFDPESGEFVAVPEGDALLSPVNRLNPDLTDADGHFGWDAISGFYKVRAEKAGCVAPFVTTQTYVETDVLASTPPISDLDLRLDCGAGPLYLPLIQR